MKKATFYSMQNENGKTVAKQRQGWTDGKYNYYKSKFNWWCIEPESGLGIGWKETRAAAQELAAEYAEQIKEVKSRADWQTAIDRFNQAIAAATA